MNPRTLFVKLLCPYMPEFWRHLKQRFYIGDRMEDEERQLLVNKPQLLNQKEEIEKFLS